MWLSLMGRAMTLAESHRAFGTRGAGWVPPDEATVLAVLRRMLRGQAVHGTTRVAHPETRRTQSTFDGADHVRTAVATDLREESLAPGTPH